MTTSALICTQKQPTIETTAASHACEARIRQLYPSVEVYHAGDLDWAGLKRRFGSQAEAYRQVAQAYDVIVLIEPFDGHLTMGLYSLGQAKLAAGISPFVWRGELKAVLSLEKVPHAAWNGPFARVILTD